MAHANPYIPKRSFSDDATSNVSGRTGVNADAIDAEFNAISESNNKIIKNLKMIQRDDLRLGDEVVEIHTLAREVLMLLGNYRLLGVWRPNTMYRQGDVVGNGEFLYVCAIEHESGASFIDDDKWRCFGPFNSTDAMISAQNAHDFATQAQAALADIDAAISSANEKERGITNAAIEEERLITNEKFSNLSSDSVSKGDALIAVKQPFSGAVARSQHDKNAERISIKDFGAVGDGVADDTAAIQLAINATAGITTLHIPEGSYIFKSPLTLPPVNSISIKGAGRHTTKLIYAGSQKNVDLITVGNGAQSYHGLSIFDLNIDSVTSMIGGCALRIRKCQNAGNVIHNVSFSVLNAPKYLNDAVWFDNVNVVEYSGFEINVLGTAIRVNGDSQLDSGSDLLLDNGTITFANVGVHCAGGFGGLYIGSVLFYGNSTHCVVDNAVAARWNRELIFSEVCVFDACKDYALFVDDNLGAGKNITFNAFCGSAGHIGSGGAGTNIRIKNWGPQSRVYINSATIFNAKNHNIQVDDALPLVTVGIATELSYCGGYGIYATVSNNLVRYQCSFVSCALGNAHPNVRNMTSVPVSNLRSSSGTLATAAGTIAYNKIGSIVFVQFYISIPNNGSGSGAILADLPYTVRQDSVIAGRANSISGKMLQGVMASNTNYITIVGYDGSYPATNGETLILSGTYECY